MTDKKGIDVLVTHSEGKHKEKQSATLDWSDIDAVANSRFFKKSGQRYLMLLAIVIMGLAILTIGIPLLSIPPLITPPIYYILVAIAAVIFVYVYGKRQRQAKKELREVIKERQQKQDATEE